MCNCHQVHHQQWLCHQLDQEFLSPQAPQVGQGIKCLTQQNCSLFFTQANFLPLCTHVLDVLPTPQASNHGQEQLETTSPNLPCNTQHPACSHATFKAARAPLACKTASHALFTQELRVLCIRVYILEEPFNLLSVEWLVVCGHNVPDKTS